MRFTVYPLRLHFEAQEPIHFPVSNAGNVLRGALGHALDAEIFRPKLTDGPSGLADPPRPFVFRVRALEGMTIEPGDRFRVDMNLFSEALAEPIAEALAAVAARGLGPGRGRARFVSREGTTAVFDLEPSDSPVRGAQVAFLTPTEIKGNNGQLLSQPDFEILIARIRDRISTLRSLYGVGPLEMDFRGFAERAAQVRITNSELQRLSLERTSTRTGQRHPLGGFVGTVQYEGELAEFAPYLQVAAFTGVGRQTVWGKGEIAVCNLNA